MTEEELKKSRQDMLGQQMAKLKEYEAENKTLRVRCLELAAEYAGSADSAVEIAQQFIDFIENKGNG